MAAFTSAGVTFNTTAGNKTVVATPAAGDLIIVIAPCTLSGGTTNVTDNNSDGKGTYTKIDVDRTGFSTNGVLTMWVRNALIGSASSTTFTAAQAGSTGGGLQVCRISGMSIVGLGAIRGAGGQSSGGAASTPAPVLLRRTGTTFSGTQAALTGNLCISAVANGTNPAATTPRSSPAWTGSANNGYATPTTGMRTAFINSGETASTLTWGGTSASAFASMAIELDVSVPVYDYVLRNQLDSDKIVSREGVMRKATW